MTPRSIPESTIAIAGGWTRVGVRAQNDEDTVLVRQSCVALSAVACTGRVDDGQERHASSSVTHPARHVDRDVDERRS